jgi:hypothetical protein
MQASQSIMDAQDSTSMSKTSIDSRDLHRRYKESSISDETDKEIFSGDRDSSLLLGFSLNASFSDFKTTLQRAVSGGEEIQISEEERELGYRKAFARSRTGSQKQIAEVITRNDKEFRQLKQDVKNTGMVTHIGVAHVRNKSIGICRVCVDAVCVLFVFRVVLRMCLSHLG